MRRILGAMLALALWTSTAHAASTLVILHETASANAANGARVQEGYVFTALDRMGASYDRVRSSQFVAGAPIQNLRRGKYFNGVDTTTYSYIIHVGYYVGRSASFDSLLLARNYCSVVHTIIGNHNADSGGPLATAAACSTGVGSTITAANDSSWVTYRVGSPGTRWVQLNSGGATPVNSTRLNRGFRPVWGMRSSAHTGTVNAATAVSNFREYDDSFDGTYPTNPDTVSLWVILNRDTTTAINSTTGVVQNTGTPLQFTGQAAAKPTILVAVTYKYATYAGEATPYIAAIALGDSLSGGALGLSSSERLPLETAIHIDDGWKRGDSRNGGTVYGGIDIADTTYLKQSIDSLRVLGEPIVVGVELESLGLKQNYDDRWWKAAGGIVHYTPHCHAGTTNSTGQLQTPQNSVGPYWRMIDLWGTNNRTRIAWGGPRGWNLGRTLYGWGMGQDSSLHALHRRAFWLCDSAFGASRVDHVAMPPGDDWSATYGSSTGIGNWPLPMTLDSLIFAWDQAGGRGIRTNAASTTSLVSQRIGSYGYLNGPMDYTVALTADSAADHRGWKGRVVACPSYPTSASSLAYSRLSAGKGIRAFNSIFYGRTNTTYAGVSATENEGAVAQVIAIHVSDLGGDKWGFPTRPGWLCIKYPVMAMRAINAVAIRQIVRVVYPEEMTQ